MGTWATGIYADDEAQDARDSYREILGSGLDGAKATDRFLKEWKGAMKDSDDGPIIWFALTEPSHTVQRTIYPTAPLHSGRDRLLFVSSVNGVRHEVV
jgi:hypothetical protein